MLSFWFIRREVLGPQRNVRENFCPGDGSGRFLRNVGQHLQYHTTYKARKSTLEQRVKYRVNKNLLLLPVLSQSNPIHTRKTKCFESGRQTYVW
jgi:hypothetical protein